MAEVLGLENDPNLSTDDMAKIFQEKSDKGEVTSAEVIIFFVHAYSLNNKIHYNLLHYLFL